MSIILVYILDAAPQISKSNGFKCEYSFFIIYFIGYKIKLSINSGTIVLLDAISKAAFSKELNGLSNIMH